MTVARPTRLRLLVLLLAIAPCAALGFAYCRRPRPPPADVVVVQDFEGVCRISTWPKEGSSRASISTAWAQSGIHSLAVDPGAMGALADFTMTDWSGYSVLRFTVHNPGPTTVPLGLEIQDQHRAFHERHQQDLGVPPGDHVITIDLAGGLHRGEENRPYRGQIKTPIDAAHISRVAFTNRGSATTVYLDDLTVERRPPLVTAGGYAFDFGPSTKHVMEGTQGVFETTFYTPERGFGMVGTTPFRLRYSMSYPTPLLGDGLGFDGGGFRVDLKGGRYLGWIAFERGGFWEGEQTGYRHAEVSVNGAVVARHDFTPAGPHFLFEDTEIVSPNDIATIVVRPEHAIQRFSFDAAAGANTFTLAVTDRIGPPLRVAGIFLAPDTAEGRGFIAAHEDRQWQAIAAAFTPADKSRRGGDRRAKSSDLVVEPMEVGAEMYPGDLPADQEAASALDPVGVPGHSASVQLGLYSNLDLTVHVDVGAFTSASGAALPSPTVLQGRYLPTRGRQGGVAWTAVSHYRPDPDLRIGPSLARPLVLQWDLPPTIRGGTYSGTVRLLAPNLVRELTVRVSVLDLDLPEIPIPVGLFMSALPFGPEILGEARFWELQQALIDEQSRAGLTCTTGGPGLAFTQTLDGTEPFTGEAALHFLELAQRGSVGRTVVTYGGFFDRLSTCNAPTEPPPDRPLCPSPETFATAFSSFAAGHRLPPFYFYAYDEPGTERETQDALALVLPFTRAGLRTIGFASERPGDPGFDRLVDATYALAYNGHSAPGLRALAVRGGHPWVYNNGLDRYALGPHLYRQIALGVEGRLEWIGLITQGFAFNDLDGREAATSAFLVHDGLGILPTPRWLAAREGLFDLRLHLALDKQVPATDPARQVWPLTGYQIDEDAWPPSRLTAARQAMAERLRNLVPR